MKEDSLCHQANDNDYCELGKCSGCGHTPPSVEQFDAALEKFRKGAEEGDADMQAQLGLLLSTDAWRPAQPQEAKYWLQRAIDQGNIDAMMTMADACHSDDPEWHDPEFCFQLLTMAAERYEPRAMNNLAACYEMGFGADKDLKKALEWYEKAYLCGYSSALKDVMNLNPDSDVKERMVEKEHRNSLISAILNVKPDQLRSLLDNGGWDISLCHDINSDGDPWFGVIPVGAIPRLWEMQLLPLDDWRDKFRPVVADMVRRNQEIKSILFDELHVPVAGIDFKKIADALSMVPDTIEEALDPFTVDEMLAKGCTQLDLELYLAILKLDLKRVENLLSQGARYLFDIFENNDFRVELECELSDVEERWADYGQDMGAVIDTSAELHCTDSETMHIFLGHAVYSKLCHLIKEYAKKQ